MTDKPSAKPVILLPSADRDVRDALEFYRTEGGPNLALQWVQALQVTLKMIADYPVAGSPRYAELLKIAGLRNRRVAGFPYLVFYNTQADSIEIWRVLHGHKDIPVWLQTDEE